MFHHYWDHHFSAVAIITVNSGTVQCHGERLGFFPSPLSALLHNSKNVKDLSEFQSVVFSDFQVFVL
jgi:hypothetical protein